MPTDLERWVSTHASITEVFAAASYDTPHCDIAHLHGPFYLVCDDLTIDTLEMWTGTLVVTGNLRVSRWLDIQRDGRQLANVIVLGDCTLGVAYLDGFLIVRGALVAHTFIGDSTWDGGLFVAGEVTADCLVLHNTGAEIDGEQHTRFAATSESYARARYVVPDLFAEPDDEDRATAEETEGDFPEGRAIGKPDPRGWFITLRDRGGAEIRRGK